MILKLMDKTEIQLTDHEAQAVEKMVEQGKEFIKIGTTLIKRSQIAQITPGGLPNVDIFDNKQKLPEGPKCHGQYSIQNEINRIIRNEYDDWPKKIRDTKLREEIRQRLRKTGAE